MGKKKSAPQKARAAVQGQEAIYSALTQITEAVSNSQNLQELFPAIHGIVGELMPAKNFYIAICEKDEQGIEFVTFPFFQDEIDEAPAGRVPLRKSFTGYVIRTGIPLLADDKIGRQLLRAGELEEFMGTDSAIWLGVPLKTREQTIGAVVVQSYDRHDEYGEREKQILSFISSQIAIAIELTRYREKLEDLVQKRTNELLEEKKIQEILFEISQAVYGADSLRGFLLTVQNKVGQLMDARNFYVALYDSEVEKFHFPYFSDEFDRYDASSLLDLHDTLTDYARRNGPLLADHKVHQSLIEAGKVAGVRGTDSMVWLGVPLLAPGKADAIGVMAVQSYENRHCYSEKEKKILMNISTTVALAIDRITLVTDLFHHFNNAMTGIRGNAEFLCATFADVVAWVERLNQYTERYGAPPGKCDDVELRAIAGSLKQALTSSELRIGKIIEGIEDAARRINFTFNPIIFNEPPKKP